MPYAPGAERGIRWDDPALGIEWPITEGVIVSDKDAIVARPRAGDARMSDAPARARGAGAPPATRSGSGWSGPATPAAVSRPGSSAGPRASSSSPSPTARSPRPSVRIAMPASTRRARVELGRRTRAPRCATVAPAVTDDPTLLTELRGHRGDRRGDRRGRVRGERRDPRDRRRQAPGPHQRRARFDASGRCSRPRPMRPGWS